MTKNKQALFGFAVFLLTAAAATADLVITSTGDVIKVTEWRLEDEKFHLTLPSGGRLILPLLRVERVLDDEIPSEAEAPLEEPTAVFSLAYSEGDRAPETPYGELILRAARDQELNPRLVAAVVRAESSYRAEVVSSKGARGLMQLMPATAKRFGVETGELFDPEANLAAGTRYLAWLRKRFDDRLPLVLAAYNAGEGSVDRYDGVPPYGETRRYLHRIYDSLGLSRPSPEETSR